LSFLTGAITDGLTYEEALIKPTYVGSVVIAATSILVAGLAVIDQLIGAHEAALVMFETAACGTIGSVAGLLYVRRVSNRE